MKVAYIAHPIGGDVENNLKKVAAIAREINLTEPEVVPFAPYFLDCHALDDSNIEERQRGIKNDDHFLKSGVVDEIRLYGDRISQGMMNEIFTARVYGIKVVASTPETEKQLKELNL